MIPLLNEYCLNHIFSYLKPHELINVSEVCQLWKHAAKREWREVNIIHNFKYVRYDYHVQTAIVIPENYAKRIVIHAAQYIDILNLFDYNRQYYMFGPYSYRVEGSFDSGSILKLLLSANATKITKVEFRLRPDVETLTALIETNKITCLGFEDLSDCHEYIPTDGIESLFLDFCEKDTRRLEKNRRGRDLTSFEGYFPNLKKLNIYSEIYDEDFLRHIFSKILPHVRKITYFRMSFEPENRSNIQYDVLKEIFLLPLLEELRLVLPMLNDTKQNGDTFFANLRTNCPKLRILKLHHHRLPFTQRSLPTLMSLPDLESLDMILPFGFSQMDFPVMKNLSSVKFLFLNDDPTLAGFPSAVRKMPNLKTFQLVFTGIAYEQAQLRLACDLLSVAASQGKEIVFTRAGFLCTEICIKVVKIHNLETAETSNEVTQTLHIDLKLNSCELFIECIRKFVRSNLSGYEYIDIVDSSD